MSTIKIQKHNEQDVKSLKGYQKKDKIMLDAVSELADVFNALEKVRSRTQFQQNKEVISYLKKELEKAIDADLESINQAFNKARGA